ncbi:methyltransferase [Rhizomicrobium electricum]|uniref:Methyltransferase n=1 Tax=Rhizomicrobium electricum TaxID=480070 RepID=A0ABN1DZW7_9PROT|nr:tRNA1(Val) A37 N6-methylase TrmN6 [Rhizomicrobium electricum]
MSERFLGGRVIVRQSETGFRAGLDAVMLAAAVPDCNGEVLELGAGAGTASLCLAARQAAVTVVGLEIDPELVALAGANAEANAIAGRVTFAAADIFDLPAAYRRSFNHVLCNPPFHGDEGQAAPDPAKARALQDGGRLAAWLEVGLKRTVSGGTFTAILRADRLGEALAALPERGVTIFPLWPKAGVAAKRVIVQARQGSRAPLVVAAGLVLHRDDGTYTAEADAVLREGEGLEV